MRIVGFDESIAQNVQMRKAYSHSDIAWGQQFVDTVKFDTTTHTTHIDYTQFHALSPDSKIEKKTT